MMRSTRWLQLVGQAWLAVAIMSSSLWAMDRRLPAAEKNVPDAPVQITSVRAKLVETYTAPTQIALPGESVRTSRVRYANRAGQAPSVFLLAGEAKCVNRSDKTIAAVEVAIVLLDAFQQPIPAFNGRDPYLVEQVVKPIPRGGSQQLRWESRIASVDVYEVAVIVKRVKFADDTVWSVPDEELVDIF